MNVENVQRLCLGSDLVNAQGKKHSSVCVCVIINFPSKRGGGAFDKRRRYQQVTAQLSGERYSAKGYGQLKVHRHAVQRLREMFSILWDLGRD